MACAGNLLAYGSQIIYRQLIFSGCAITLPGPPALLQPVELDDRLVKRNLHGLALHRFLHALRGLELTADFCF